MRFVLMALAAALAGVCVASAADGDKVYGSSDEIFQDLREQHNPGYYGSTVEQAIDQFVTTREEDKGSYPASEIWDHNFDLRRHKPEKPRYFGRTYFKLSDDDISGVNKFEKELELNVAYSDWASYFRFSDVNVFAGNNDPFRWEKAQVRYKHDDVKVTAGSISALFGRGLALNMFEERTLDFDNEAEGIKVEYDLGDSTEVTALWGTLKARNDRRDAEVAAARVSGDLSPELTGGLSYVRAEWPDLNYTAENPIFYKYDLLGQDLTYRSGDVAVYGEMVRLQRPVNEIGGTDHDYLGYDGRGYYGSVTYSLPNLAFVGEYKDYRYLAQPFSVLPPVRRYEEQAQADPNDDQGYGGTVTWAPRSDGSSTVMHYSQGNAHDGNNPFTEAALIYTSPAALRATYVLELWKVNLHGDKRDIQRATVNYQIDEDYTASTFLEREYRPAGYPSPHADYIVTGEVDYQSIFSAVYTYETTRAQLDETTDWGIWELKYRPTQDREFGLSYGSRREGFVCSGGVCRLEPAFDGFRLDYLVRF